MSRIPTATRESVPQDQLAAFDEMVSQQGSVPGIGPISIMINVPELPDVANTSGPTSGATSPAFR